MNFSIQVSEGREAIDAIAEEWDGFAEESFATTFSRPLWALAWMDAFTPGKVTIISARAGNRLVGVLPVARMRTDARGLFFTRVAPLAADVSDYQPPLVEPGLAPVVLPLMMDAALRRFGRSGVYWWPHIPAGNPNLEVLRACLAARGMFYVEERETAPRLHLAGASYAEVERGWSKKHRLEVRRRRKRLAEQGPLSLWQPATLAEAETALDAFFKVHDAKWLAEGYPGRFQNVAERRHFQAVLRRLWGRGIHFSTLRCGAADVSYRFGLLSDGWFLAYRPTYHPEFARYSPGKVHLSILIEEACRAGWNGIDFLLGTEGYKLDWSNDSTDVVNIHAGFHRWAPSYFWFATGKPFVKTRFSKAYIRLLRWEQQHVGLWPWGGHAPLKANWLADGEEAGR